MREIKFRGKSVDDGKWYYGLPYFSKDRIKSQIRYDISERGCTFVDVIPKTISEFTGLKDKNGVEIYEDDVVIGDVMPYRTAHEKLIEMGLRLKVTKNYADGVFSHEWWNENDDRVIVFYINEKVTSVYEGNNEIMAIIPQYLEELK